MKNQNLNDQATETRVEISANLLEKSNFQPDLDQTELDFIQQNALIDQELNKYDGHLNTCAMCLFKTYMVISLISSIIQIPIQSLALFNSRSVLPLGSCILILLDILFCPVGMYANLLLWMALRSKDPLKAEKSISIFKIVFLWGFIKVLINSVEHLSGESPSWVVIALIFVFGLTLPALNLGTATYIKKVLLKRNVFQGVSSSQ